MLFEQRIAEARSRGGSAPQAHWQPFPGSPQVAALESEADELFYGGAGGGGKTDLLLGAAGTQHQRSIIFRRIFPSLRGIIERSREIYNATGASHARDSYNEQLHIWRLRDGRMIEFGAIQYEADKEKYRGQPHDLYAWDELPEFPESIFRFVNAWNRSTNPRQRCRVIATGNPPSSQEGRWIISYWAPWLDPQHPNPAMPGELRWFAVLDGRDVEVKSGEPLQYKGETIYPRSRTFIPARLEDNPILEATGYRAVLQGLPEPLRSQMLYGDFGLSIVDHPWQLIPTWWVELAMSRPRETEDGRSTRPDGEMSALGVDIAHGGADETVLARRWGAWFDELESYPGSETPTGQAVAAKVMVALTAGGYANLDGIGVGTSAYDQLSQSSVAKLVHSVIFSAAARDWQGKPVTDKTGKLQFANMRAYAWWHFRELLDPENGHEISLPNNPKLKADLCTPRYEVRLNKIYVESKEEISERLGGRSTDAGDAVVLSALPPQTPPPPSPPRYSYSPPARPNNPLQRGVPTRGFPGAHRR